MENSGALCLSSFSFQAQYLPTDSCNTLANELKKPGLLKDTASKSKTAKGQSEDKENGKIDLPCATWPL